jgi:hypothetical protein
MKPIQLQVILGRVATKSDGSLSLNFSTGEMTAEESCVLFKLCRINLKMLLTPMGEAVEAPVEVKGELSRKTHSARLRGVLFVLFKHLESQGSSGGKTWESWYADRMEAIIEDIKTQLPEQ